jgi:hypothetical protein
MDGGEREEEMSEDKCLIVLRVVDSSLIHAWMIYERCVKESRLELRQVGDKKGFGIRGLKFYIHE